MLFGTINGSASGGGAMPTITPSSKITSNLDGESKACKVTGSFSVVSAIGTNAVAFTVSPPPSSVQLISGGFKQSGGSSTRDIQINTNGEVTNIGNSMAAGYTWDVDFAYPISS